MDTDDKHLSYIPINAEYDHVSKIFQESYGSTNYCISALFKITNPELQTGFDACVAEIAAKRGVAPKIRTMFHGTTMTAVHSIAALGFDPAYSKVAVYGKGTYASPRVKTALSYCKDVREEGDFSMVFLCDFVVGKFSKKLDATVDSSGNGSDIYVTPYHYGIIPKYLICFYRWTE